MQFRIDRFTFRSGTNAFVELGSEEQVQKAVKTLNGQQLENRTFVVRPLTQDFVWETGFKKENRMFIYDAETPSQAIQGLLDGRRYRLYVDRPGWQVERNGGKSVNAQRREITRELLGPFGVETIGGLNPTRNKGRWKAPMFVTYVEFTSKDSAEQAVEALDGQVFKGLKVYLRRHTVTPQQAEQFGKVDMSLIAQLQQQGIPFEEEHQVEVQN